MNNFKIIYKILKYLETAMDYSEPDYEPLNKDALGISEERRTALIEQLLKNGYIEGVEIKKYIGNVSPVISYFKPKITLKGLEYLHNNTMMQKIFNAAKGIKDIIPNL